MFLIQFSYFTAVDEFLLDWLPLAVGFALTVWLLAELKNTPPANEAEEPVELPKPLPAKEMAKPSTKKSAVAALIASEYQKRS